MKKYFRKIGVVAGALAMTVGGSVVPVDAATSMKACVNKMSLAVRIIPAKKKCTSAERSVAVGGSAVPVDAATSVKVCVNKKTLAVRVIPAKKKCTSAERSASWSVAGAKGDNDATSTTEPAGGMRITELSVCDGLDAGTVADELCKIGMTGPGGGPVFFIDSQDQYASFCAVGDCNYLEAAPADVDEAGGDFTSTWCSDTTTSLGLFNSSNSAIGAGRTNTITADTTCTSGAVQTAVDYTAPAFNGVAKDDWWLPSIGELSAMYSNLRQAGLGSFLADHYWSSSEVSPTNARFQSFNLGGQVSSVKTGMFRVRPARGF